MRSLHNSLQGSAKPEAYRVLDDQALMALVNTGNHSAFTELVSRHTANMLKLARRTLLNSVDAEDVVQGVFIRVWQKPERWQAEKSAFSTWLYKVVLNACYDSARVSARLKAQSIEGYDAALPDVLEQICDFDQQTHRQQRLQSALLQLPNNQRDAINLAVFAGLPQKQVAQVLGVSVKAVESLLVRAKRKLNQLVNKEQSNGVNNE